MDCDLPSPCFECLRASVALIGAYAAIGHILPLDWCLDYAFHPYEGGSVASENTAPFHRW